MAESERTRKVRSLRTSYPPQERQRKPTATRDLVLTLSVPEGDVVKVEMLDKSGQRRELSEEEFADLAGEDEEEISPEEAYAAGITDAGEEDDFELNEEGAADEEALERFILRDMIARQLIRRGVRRFILRRLHKREMSRSRGRPGARTAHQAGYKSRKNGHESTRDEG